MKRIIVISFAAALLLTGCGQAGDKTEIQITDTDLQSSISDNIAVSEITISEIGGEDGRNYTLTISQNNNTNVMCKVDNRIGKTITYHISDLDYQSITSTDITDYLDKKDELEYDVADWIDCHTEIQYDNGTTAVSDVYIPELWNKIYEVMNKYEPL